MPSKLGEAVPSGDAQESLHIKMEPEEPHSEGASQEDGAQGAWGWAPLSHGSKEKALFLPGGGRRGMGKRRFPREAAVGRWRLGPGPGGAEGLYASRGRYRPMAHSPLAASEPSDPVLGSGQGQRLRQLK